MKRFIEGEDRTQITLLPECLDDYIAEDNPIRAVEVFIDELDLGTLGFAGVAPAATGRPSYHPAILLKLYLYGYLNRIQSSRRLEREAQRNVELMWLTGRLSPDFKTIADFRRDNGPAIRNVCREFILLCRRLNLFSQAIVAIDGSKFKAVNAHDRNFTQAKLDKRIQEVEHSIDRYLAAMETADRNPSDVTETKTAHLHKKIEHLKQQMHDLKAMQAQLHEAPSGQISLTDPDARAMATSTSRGLVGYNVQTAVDARHHLIVAHEVTNVGSDRRQLVKMAKQAQAVLETPQLQVVADRGYFNGDDILACDEAGITAYVPKPMTSRPGHRDDSTRQISSMNPTPIPTGARRAANSYDALPGWKPDISSTATGVQTARIAPSRRSAHPVITAGSAVGNTRQSSKQCKGGSTAHRA